MSAFHILTFKTFILKDLKEKKIGFNSYRQKF